ncbi:hypothetical protein JFL43_08965 [Viridibacillus sp. YIM B01967]|uniref:Translation initiation factor 2 n=1 Tax=Viridibacillus soli TaxID=2798301 RepID=A0ABS1H6E5_9BACL|nr:hypothetical protein [Viridibacillus soli]
MQNKDLQYLSSQDNYPAKLAVVGAAITTLGDAISTIAAALALEEAQNSNNQNSQSQKEQEKQLMRMQNQIDYLTAQLSKIDRKKN